MTTYLQDNELYLKAMNDPANLGANWSDLYNSQTLYARMKPAKISEAEGKARHLYQLYDRLVDQAIDAGAASKEESGLAGAIDDAWQEYKQADEYAQMLKRQYIADLHPERWF